MADGSSRDVERVARGIVELARNEVLARSSFLARAVGLLELAPAQLQGALATDGVTLYFDPSRVVRAYAATKEPPTHDLVHLYLHCLLLHPFVGAAVDRACWSLACDLSVEALVAEVIGARPEPRAQGLRNALAQAAQELGRNALTAERLYHALSGGSFASRRAAWAELSLADDHELWFAAQESEDAREQPSEASDSGQGGDQAPGGAQGPSAPADEGAAPRPGAEPEAGSGAGKRQAARPAGSAAGARDGQLTPDARELAEARDAWERAAKALRVDLETLSRESGERLGTLLRVLEVGAHEERDYRAFLRQFAVRQEDLRLSDDEFDYVFYSYGLQLYGDMPLIEPLEYRTRTAIRDFCVVIDTSSSVTPKVVQAFMDATYDVLAGSGSFFEQVNVHIIQADTQVRSDTRIGSIAEMNQWRRNIKLYGGGGTDFRPAFAYVEQLLAQGAFQDLGGLIYFTDGWGIYPSRMPPYKCAFVFYDEDHRPELVPPWAIQLTLRPGEFESMSVY